MTWPVADLNPVRQLRVLAAVLPGTAIVERVIAAPYEPFWKVLSDLERSVPRIEPLVRSFEIVSRNGNRLTALVRSSAFGLPIKFEVELRDGWCWMQSSSYLVGMAATPEGSETRYAHLEGVPHRLGALLRPVFRFMVRGDVSRIERVLRT